MLLEGKALSKRFVAGDDEVWAVRELSVSIAAGEFVAIMGPSGSGKSTLLAMLAGLEQPSAGEVVLEGQSLSALSDTQRALLRRSRVGFVFQTFNLVPVLTLEDNVALPFLLAGRVSSAAKEKVRLALDRVGLTHRAKHLPERVSVGERQRAAVARALVVEPAIVFADEPTGALDSQRGDSVLSLLREAATQERRTVVMVTHDEHAAKRADRILRMKDGRLDSP